MPLTLETVERLQRLLEEERQRILNAQASQALGAVATSPDGIMRGHGPVIAKGIGQFLCLEAAHKQNPMLQRPRALP